MTRALIAGLVLVGACAHGPAMFRSPQAKSNAATDSLYWHAVAKLDPSHKAETLDVAIASLDAYLASTGNLKHLAEAVVLRKLARSAQQLARVEAALLQARTAESRPRESARDEEAVKEIQRLKDDLAKANEELERIKKRLAAPKP